MEKDNGQINETNVVEGNEEDYISVIEELKKNTVAKEDYKKLQMENSKLIKALADNSQVGSENDVKLSKTADELSQEFFSNFKGMSNLEVAQTMLELRERTLEESGRDIFLPSEKTYIPTQDDINSVTGLVEGLKSCIETAQGDDAIFNRELDRIIVRN